jgi:hypothetical protein
MLQSGCSGLAEIFVYAYGADMQSLENSQGALRAQRDLVNEADQVGRV